MLRGRAGEITSCAIALIWMAYGASQSWRSLDFTHSPPALAVVLATCLLLGWFVLLPAELQSLGKHIGAAAAFILNFAVWHEGLLVVNRSLGSKDSGSN
jgi:hypothetical protein